MRKMLFPLILSLFFITGCSDDEAESPKCPSCESWQECNAGTSYKCSLVAGKCRSNADCNAIAGKPKCGGSDGYTCVADSVNPCDGITCSGEGTCSIVDNAAKCNCKPGFEADGLSCIADKCNGITCSYHGNCSVENGSAVCDCEAGFDANGTECIKSTDKCAGVTCSDHGSCSATSGVAVCSCNTGYYVDGLECLKEGDPCDGQTCSGHGVCQDSAGNAVCTCDAGYHSDGLKCIQNSTPCDGVNCGNGICVIDNDQAQCNCNDGYIAQELTCVKVSDPCDGQRCSNKGQCENINGVATCSCDDGYAAEGLECVKVVAVDWCKVVGPTTINTTVGDEVTPVYAQIFAQTLTDGNDNIANSLIVAGLGYTTESIVYPVNQDQFTWVDATYNETCSNCGYNDEYSAAFPATTAGLYSYVFRFSVDGGDHWRYCDANSLIQSDNINPGTANVTEVVDPCNGIDCSGEGVCKVVNEAATCECNAGYTASGTTCEKNAIPEVTWCNVQSPKSFTALVGSDDATKIIYGQVLIPEVTNGDTAVETVKGQLGTTTADLTAPINYNLLTWTDATFNQKVFENHEYQTEMTFDKKGAYNYIYRFSADNGASWKYCHVPGVIEDGSDVQPGRATINGLCDNVNCSDHGSCSVVDERATCECETGYDLSDDKLSCIEQSKVNWCVIQSPKGVNSEISDTPVTVYGRVYVAGITEQNGEQTQIQGQLGYVASDTIAFPIDDTVFTWVAGIYNETCTGCGNNDEYNAMMPLSTAGNFRYLYRFSVDNGKNWSYCDQNGVVENETFSPGIATVTEANSPCDGVTCDDHGTCSVDNDAAVCNCEAGYHMTTDPAGCEKNAAPKVEWCKLISPTDITVYTDDSVTVPVYSEVYIPTITTVATEGTTVIAQQGFIEGEISGLTDQDITWVDAVFSQQKFGANHEYIYNWTYDKNFESATTVEYVYRFSADSGQTWSYCDTTGPIVEDAVEADINGGHVTVNERPKPTVGWCIVQSPQHINALTGDSAVIYGQVLVDGITTEATENADIKGQFAMSGAGVTVSSISEITALNWSDASFNVPSGNNHEYMINQDFTAPGEYQYFYRFSADGGSTWTLCDIDGDIKSDDITFNSGTADIVDPINPCDGVTCSDHGTCSATGDVAVCTCEDGYLVSDDQLSCIIESGPEVGWCVVQNPKSFDGMVGDTINFYGRVYVAGITETDGNDADITAQLGVQKVDAFPENGELNSVVPEDYQWDENGVVFNAQYGNDYEYVLSSTFEEESVGSYLYLYRFSADGGTSWTYCDVVDQVIDDDKVYPGTATISAIPGPCDSVTCSGHGTCVESNGDASCDCDDGYVNEGLSCNPVQVASVDFCQVMWTDLSNKTVGEIAVIPAQIYSNGLTNSGMSQNSAIVAALGYTTEDVTKDPANQSFTWVEASFYSADMGDFGNNHEYQTSWTFDAQGTYNYIFRFSVDNGVNWSYCDETGLITSDMTIDPDPGMATVVPGEADPCENIWCSHKGGCMVDIDNNPYCNCTDVQYKPSADGLDCIHVNHTYHDITIDGSDSEWKKTVTDLGDGFGGGESINTHITWNAENIYILITGKDFTVDAGAALEIYLDDYKGFDLNHGVPYVFDHDGHSDARSLPGAMTADWYISISQNGGKLFGFDTPEGGSPWWSATGTPIASEDISFSGTITELVIPISALNLDSDQLAVAAYLTNTSNDYVYGVWPTSNATSEFDYLDNVDVSSDQYYQFTIAEDQQPNSVDNIQ